MYEDPWPSSRTVSDWTRSHRSPTDPVDGAITGDHSIRNGHRGDRLDGQVASNRMRSP